MQRQALDEAKALIPDLDDKASARRAFVEKIRSLIDPSAANREDASDSFFKGGGDELMDNLKVDEEDLDREVGGKGGSAAALPLGVGSVAIPSGGAASLTDVLSGFKAAALNVLNFTTYYEMKARAGNVGKNGVARLVDQLAPDRAENPSGRPQLRGTCRRGNGRQLGDRQDQEPGSLADGLLAQRVLAAHDGVLPQRRRPEAHPRTNPGDSHAERQGCGHCVPAGVAHQRRQGGGVRRQERRLRRSRSQWRTADAGWRSGRRGRWGPPRADYAFEPGKFFNLEASDSSRATAT